MFKPVNQPRVAVLGLSLDLYQRALPGLMDRLGRQLGRFVEKLKLFVAVTDLRLCYLAEHVVEGVAEAKRASVDAILLVPVSYTASGMTLGPILRAACPVVIWNTQEVSTISDDYNFDVLLMNHVTQGTQDLTNALLRGRRRFGMESGHYADEGSLGRLVDWLRAARAKRLVEELRVGLLGHPFQGMCDFAVDETRMAANWGPQVVRLSIPRLVELARLVDEKQIDESVKTDAMRFERSGDIPEVVHRTSARLECAMRKLVEENGLDALTFNFMDLISDGRFETLPFLGINKLIAEGLGYSGEGDVVTAAHMAQMRQLCGVANFTEIFTVDYQKNHLLMMHMQECNPALARRDRKVRLVQKDFWAPGIQPYVGMVFTLEPGPVTLTCLTTNESQEFHYIACQAEIVDHQPLKELDVPHWLVQLSEPAGEFLTRYSMAGGPHHLVAVPGQSAEIVSKLAHLQGIGFTHI